ncbi:hypothetical protein FQN54_002286 [Arachnomyces sp. PD_36]|nr:hypothetical protein FQN54_002286 [Arachnomyces sp. PD_36]
MRLINNATLELESFMDLSQAPPYAILSHTWGDGEVTLQDFTSPDREAAQRLPGYAKIELICRQALVDELPYSWVDTCCIDKTSSAELSEAINSMYEWYKASAVCYVFLPDLAPQDPVLQDEETSLEGLSIDEDENEGHRKNQPSAQFAALRWFRRGWTLQELIAPSNVRFYDKAWKLRGTKESLAPAISAITRIEEPVLLGRKQLYEIPIARRMSWAAGRATTRAEDVAYCLLGIFDVNMPMLYGEGARAFIRLQEMIMHDSNDMSLFAWCAGGSETQRYRGVLALSPQEFADAGSIETGNDSSLDVEFSVTNKGISFKSRVETEDSKPLIQLNCESEGKLVGIYLQKHAPNTYARARPNSLALGQAGAWGTSAFKSKEEKIYINKILQPALAASIGGAHRHGIYLRNGFRFTAQTGIPGKIRSDEDLQAVSWAHPEEQWDPVRSLFITNGGAFTGVITAGDSFLVLGMDNGKPWISFLNPAHELFAKAAPAGGLWNLSEMRKIGKHLNYQIFNGLEVEMSEDVVDGENVFCVDISPEKEKGKPRLSRKMSI